MCLGGRRVSKRLLSLCRWNVGSSSVPFPAVRYSRYRNWDPLCREPVPFKSYLFLNLDIALYYFRGPNLCIKSTFLLEGTLQHEVFLSLCFYFFASHICNWSANVHVIHLLHTPYTLDSVSTVRRFFMTCSVTVYISSINSVIWKTVRPTSFFWSMEALKKRWNATQLSSKSYEGGWNELS